MQSYDIEAVTGERYDRVFRWKQAASPNTAMPIGDDWDVVMIIFTDDLVVATSTGDDPEIQLTVEPAAEVGRIDLLLGQDLIAMLLQPYGAPSEYYFRIDLIDIQDATNIVPFLKGRVLVTKGFGP